MKKIFLYVLLLFVVTTACDDFLHPDQGLVLAESDVPQDEVELRSLSLGLYSLQQDLVEQIVMLGELRGDLLTVTDNADPDLREISNFQVSPDNRYASPSNFYKLIAACNKVINILEKSHPEVIDETSIVTNYHRMYGEAVVMRAWSYFYAVRIYDEIPYIPESLSSIEEINAYVNSSAQYHDTAYVDYAPNGLDTKVVDTTFVYEDRQFFSQDVMTRKCLKDIEEKVRVVGVDYSALDQIDDPSWNVTVWNENALKAFKIQMYMHLDNYDDALNMLNQNFLNLNAVTGEYAVPYALDRTFQYNNWKNIFTSIDGLEHIFTIQFQKTSASWQLNNLQSYFSVLPPNVYALKPTAKAVRLWESQWKNYDIVNFTIPSKAYTEPQGEPGDYYRGYGKSYVYAKDGFVLDSAFFKSMLDQKKRGNLDEVNELMRGVDTVVYKYTIGKGVFDKDANFIVYRAASMHLYAAEIYSNRKFLKAGSGNLVYQTIVAAEKYIYDGDYLGAASIGTPESGKQNNVRMGVAGRVGFESSKGISVDKSGYYKFDPNTNRIIGYQSFNGDDNAKQLYMENITMDQRARELAYEGERFFDYVRIARRREKAGNNGIQWLAESISKSYPVDERSAIKARLMNEKNWYLPFILK